MIIYFMYWIGTLHRDFLKVFQSLLNMYGPKGSRKAVSHMVGASPWVTSLKYASVEP